MLITCQRRVLTTLVFITEGKSPQTKPSWKPHPGVSQQRVDAATEPKNARCVIPILSSQQLHLAVGGGGQHGKVRTEGEPGLAEAAG